MKFLQTLFWWLRPKVSRTEAEWLKSCMDEGISSRQRCYAAHIISPYAELDVALAKVIREKAEIARLSKVIRQECLG